VPIQTAFTLELFETNVATISDPVVFCMNMHIASTRGSEIFATPFARKGFGLGMDGFNVSLDVGWS